VAYEEPYFIKAIVNEESQKAFVKGITLPNGEINISYTPFLKVNPGETRADEFSLFLARRISPY